ncbi:MAG: TonB-dependent receptor [Bacteriovoracaceae bacterium]|jgi:hemoglobin/transferrin/lactoferrin receptor protein|nr:TonB-dependent receptor [Bacteriovoracaceae bacterium]
MKLSLLMLLFSFCASANYRLEKVIYTGDQKPEVKIESEDEIDSEKILDTKATSIDDILRVSNNATTARGPRSSGEGIQVRGLDSDKIFVKVDGVRQNYREGHSSMTPVDLENLKMVKIDTGSSSFLNGSSLGGGVNFITKDARDYLAPSKKQGSEFLYQNASAASEQKFNAKTIFKKDYLSGLFSFTTTEAKDLELNNDEKLDNSSYKDFSGLVKLEYKKYKFSYERFQRDDKAPLDPSLNPPNRPELLSLQANSTLIKNTYRIGYDDQYSFYVNDYKTKKIKRENEVVQQRSIVTTGLTAKNRYQDIDYGLEAFYDSLDSSENENVLSDYPKANSLNTSVYAQNTFKMKHGRRDISIVPGLKFSQYTMQTSSSDDRSKSASIVSKKLYADYELLSNGFLYASYVEGFNSPTVRQVYPSGLHSPGDGEWALDNYFIANTSLKHEISYNREIGFKVDKSFSYKDKLTMNLSFYNNDFKNYITIQRLDYVDQDGTTQFINVKNANLNGTNFNISYLFDKYEFSYCYSRIRGKNLSENNYLEDLPADERSYQFKVYLDKYGMNLGYLGVRTDAQNRVNPETLQRTDPTPGYFVHNAFYNQTIAKNFDFGLRINNIGNTKYRKHASHLYESAQDIRLSLKYKINTL